jgi:predicted RNase H-like nuclease (RuvC/YqgF family)
MRRTSDARLDRIENKIDQLSDAMITLARAEEKLINIEKNNQTLYERMNRHSEKIDDLEGKVDNANNQLNLYGKVIWLLTSAVVIAIATRFISTG